MHMHMRSVVTDVWNILTSFYQSLHAVIPIRNLSDLECQDREVNTQPNYIREVI